MKAPSFARSKLLGRYPELADARRATLTIAWHHHGFSFDARGLGPAHPLMPVIESSKPGLAAIPRELPFPAGAFDNVVCIGALERQPREWRSGVITEMLRVARKSVFLSSAFAHPGQFGQRATMDAACRNTAGMPAWLEEESRLDLPSLADVMDEVLGLGLPFDFFGDETMLLHYADLLLRKEFGATQHLLHRQIFKSPGEPALSGSSWDIFHSYAFCIHKDRTPCAGALETPAPVHTRPPEASMSVYACCHDAADIEDFGDVKVLKVGPAAGDASPLDLNDILSDGTRLLNSRWSELSGIYRIWVNGPGSDVVGFCHYRRFFDFSGREPAPAITTIHRRDLKTVSAHFIDASIADLCLTENQVIVPPEFVFEHSAFHQYADIHTADDLCLIVSLISTRHPQLLPYARHLFSGRSLFPCNMFIMRWSLFEELCPVWFGILREFEALVPPGRATSYQNRDISFLSERLFDVWIRYAVDHLGVKLRRQPIYFVERQDWQPAAPPPPAPP